MEFLDPKKHKAHLIRLFTGYVLVAVALILTTIILLYQAYGFGLKNGEVIQNGLIFMSSRPRPANIYINGARKDKTTNARLLLPAGQYTFRLEREGYRPWKRAIGIEGGSVARFDYPVLFPTKLSSQAVKHYETKPSLMTQSPDRRWLLVQGSVAYGTFDLFDLNAESKAPTSIVLQPAIFGLTGGIHSWELGEWASDNRHVLLKHAVTVGATTEYEYILVDREKPAESLNLTRTFGINPTRLELRNRKADAFIAYDQQARTLAILTLKEPVPRLWVTEVLAYKTYGNDVVLYATTADANAGKAAIKLREGEKTYPIRQVSESSTYLLGLGQYKRAWYVVAGAPSENKTYVYRDPAHMLRSKDKPLVPTQILKATAGTYVAFSDNSRFIMVQNAQQFAVYDAETDKGYLYTT
ncbi:MAG TPA: PEGA domain-containing protein, partial [Candidatus Saccharimonadales bacterium]|nr:PEGA domain-containing protein [Candidatus Saccharimonadales bacterium]